jgi:hypothetical protein
LSNIRITVLANDGCQLPPDRFEKAVDLDSPFFDVESLRMFGVLRGGPYYATADAALHAGNAAGGYEHGAAEGHRSRPKRYSLCRIDPVLYSSHEYDGHSTGALYLFKAVQSFLETSDRRNAYIFRHLAPRCAGAPLHAIQFNEVDAVFQGDLDVVAYAPGA